MTSFRSLSALAALGLLVALGSPSRLASADDMQKGPVPHTPRAAPHAIDLAICLDTSGSMTGLINSARQKLWEVVNELAAARPSPTLRVALLTYGSSGSEEDGYVIVQTPFTTDLDLVSEKLFALGTNGGTEYVGRVVKTAVDRLGWGGPDAAKILFVCGNESADQDQTAPFRRVVPHAYGLGVRINAIYCGNPDDADAPGWREVAVLGHGRYASVDMDRGTVVVATPFDADLEALSRRINATYLGYGAQAKDAQERQARQDGNAATTPGTGAARAASKASGLYDNAGWDLVDKSKEEGFDLAKVPADQLPEEMKALTVEQRKALLETKKAERAEIQAKIQTLAAQRAGHIREQMAKAGLDDGKALDRAIRDAVREQAAEKGFAFPEASPAPVPAPATR